MASIRLHRSREFSALQERLQASIRFFDSLIRPEQHGSAMAIGLVTCGEAALANSLAVDLPDLEYCTSAVFLPVVPNHQADKGSDSCRDRRVHDDKVQWEPGT